MDYVTIKVYEETRLYLRIIAAVTGEQMVQVLDRLCRAEAERVAEQARADGRVVIFEGHMKKGKSYAGTSHIIIDRFQDSAGGEANAAGSDPGSDAGNGDSVAGDDAV
jgi:hypothetical protein